ncbi:MAG: MerR family transcriptional regulator [Akkermansiaceae bacterium]|nr:MerR family transcriptional regulator [Armatimonadota bacterium]
MGSENEILPTNRTYTVQEAAAETGLSVHTLRYYERVGLLDPPARGETSGHRKYSEDDLRRVQFLKRLRTTGMPIREMQRFVDLYRQGDETLPDREKLLQNHRCQVLAQVAELQDSLAAIEYKIASYRVIGAEKYWPEKKGCDK